MSKIPNNYDDTYWNELSANTEAKLELPPGMLHAIVNHGERSNNDQVSEAGARTPYQITPQTRKLAIDKWGIDPYLNPENAAEVAGNLLKDSLKRNKGDVAQAVGEYHGGTNRANWGPRTKKYIERVGSGIEEETANRLLAEMDSQNQSEIEQNTSKKEVPQNESDKAADELLAHIDNLNVNYPGWNQQAKPTPEQPGIVDKLKEQNFGPEDSTIASAIMNPIEGVQRLGGLLENTVNTAAGLPNPAMQDEARMYAYGPNPEQQTAAAFNVAGLGQTGTIAPIVGQAAAKAVPAVANAVKEVVPPIIQGVQKIKQGIVGTPEVQVNPMSPQSGGAAATSREAQVQALGQNLPEPITNPTKGQLTNDLEQQRFEKGIAKQPEGKKLLDTFEEHNSILSRNFDKMIEKTGSTTDSLREAGIKVNDAVVKASDKAKNHVNVLYKQAEKSVEGKKPVDTTSLVETLNSLRSFEGNSGVITAAKNELIRLGGAFPQEGKLLPSEITLPQLYEIRKAITANTKMEGPDLHYAPILKESIDSIMKENGGELYKQAMAAHAQYAKVFKNRNIIKNLISFKRGTEDRKVAFEDVFNHSILNGSYDDMMHLRRVLQTQGEEGKQAWKELRGLTVQHLKDEAFKNSARNTKGEAIISFDKLDKAIKKLDTDGKLDKIFGKVESESLRDIAEISRSLFQAPPGAINSSETATMLIDAFNNGIFGIMKLPIPILKASVKYVKDRKLKAKINEALTYHKSHKGR